MDFNWNKYGNRKYHAKSWNCWSLVCAFYKDHFGIELTEYEDDESIVPQAFIMEAENWRRVIYPDPGDVITFKIYGRPWHCGLIINSSEMFHLLKGCEVVVESFQIPMWRNRIDKFYKHTDRI